MPPFATDRRSKAPGDDQSIPDIDIDIHDSKSARPGSF
jgi:hypothetical protein